MNDIALYFEDSIGGVAVKRSPLTAVVPNVGGSTPQLSRVFLMRCPLPPAATRVVLRKNQHVS
jgi:hypothetical protein